VSRAPEVVVKVSGGGADAGSVGAHLKYISRRGSLPLELDTGETLSGSGIPKTVTTDWNLDAIPSSQRTHGKRPDPMERGATSSRGRPKAVHNIVLSMPAAVPPEKVLAAARTFARENFALMHRYALVLHTDTRHPHVHLVVKAERDDGAGRLNIYKSTLRRWREQFAQALRDQGLEANATPAALRGRSGHRLKSSIVRAELRSAKPPQAGGASTFLRRKVSRVLQAIHAGDTSILTNGLDSLKKSRASVSAHWEATARVLDARGESSLAASVRDFAATLPPVRTDAQVIAAVASRARDRNVRNSTAPADRNRGQ
jgi:hypothetical protein